MESNIILDRINEEDSLLVFSVVVGVTLGKTQSHIQVLGSAGAAMHWELLSNILSPVLNPLFVHQSSSE